MERGRGNLARFWVGMCPGRTRKSRPITRAKFIIEKPPKTYENDMNLPIFLDLTYNPCMSNFAILKGKMSSFFLISTHNQGKIFLILPITWGAHVYLVFIGSSPPPPPPSKWNRGSKNIYKMLPQS